MPVPKTNSRFTTPTPTEEDADTLVDDVRERLCLKSPVRRHRKQRVSPYTTQSSSRRKFGLRPAKGESPVNRQRHNSACSCSAFEGASGQESEEGSDILVQLLAEERLIMEAVRRIHHHNNEDTENGAPSSAVNNRFDGDADNDDDEEEKVRLHVEEGYKAIVDSGNHFPLPVELGGNVEKKGDTAK